jgi:exodeoxyribonuclease V alpha subunit
MLKVARLTPMGTARELFLATRGPQRPPYPVSFPPELVQAVSTTESGHELLSVAWELTRCAEGLDESGQRALMLLTLASLLSSHEGSTRLPIAGEHHRHFEHLLQSMKASSTDVENINRLLADPGPASVVIGRPGEYKPLLVDGEWLVHARLKHFEDRVIESFARRIEDAALSVPHADGVLDQILERAPTVNGQEIKLSDEQQHAVRRALQSRLTVISGGPGTGKTSIVVSILRALLRLDVPPVQIALAAPTGKAANRMEESIRKYLRAIPERDVHDDRLLLECPTPQTLHRLLKYSPQADRFAHHENNPLAESVVIVDESSMIDLFLMERLVRSVRPDARLILLGDSEQLPSVDAGAVFRDLLPVSAEDRRSRVAVRLTQSYRLDTKDPAGRNILSVANAINKGETAGLFDPSSDASLSVRHRVEEIAFARAELLSLPPNASPERFLHRWYQERVRALPEFERLIRKTYRFEAGAPTAEHLDDLQQLFRHFESFRILCLTRDGSATSANAANTFLHERQLQLFRNSDIAREDPVFTAGEPVLMQQNDYTRGLFNGDQGLVVRVADGHGKPALMAVFSMSEGYRAFHLDSLRRHLAHAFAMTVHKSQGSEFDAIALLLPEQELPLLTREILYTAITRSRKSAVIVGQRALLEKGAEKQIHRFSGISQALATQRPVAS